MRFCEKQRNCNKDLYNKEEGSKINLGEMWEQKPSCKRRQLGR
jgi:hypothetical protein